MKMYPIKLLDVCSLEKLLKFAYKQRISPLLMHIPSYSDRNPESDILRQCRDKLSADNICKASAGEIPWMILGQKRGNYLKSNTLYLRCPSNTILKIFSVVCPQICNSVFPESCCDQRNLRKIANTWNNKFSTSQLMGPGLWYYQN